jgi:HSP20 family protein
MLFPQSQARGGLFMPEKQSGITPTRQERRLARNTPFGLGGGPFRSLQRLADEMDRMFDDFGLGRRWGQAPQWRGAASELWAPDIEVFQKDDQLVIKADLPGLSKDEVSVDITDDAVTIEGERKAEREEEREGYYRSERSYGSFCRVIPLPEGAIIDQAKASFRHGVLEVTLPAPPAAAGKGRRLEITEGSKK